MTRCEMGIENACKNAFHDVSPWGKRRYELNRVFFKFSRFDSFHPTTVSIRYQPET